MHIERVCKFCTSKFIARTTKTQYCSNRCSGKAYKQAARQEKLENASIEAVYMGKIRTKVNLHNPIKLTYSFRGKLTYLLAGKDLKFQWSNN